MSISYLYLRIVLHKFFIKTPWWAKRLFASYVWQIPAKQKIVYLTFDDGPHPTITPWVLKELKKYEAEATFFCIGKNVVRYPETYCLILEERHSVGNHTYQHLNGWKTKSSQYLADVAAARDVIRTNLFRPPYGKITAVQAKGLNRAMQVRNSSVIMWDVLSADFDKNTSPQQCIKNVVKNVSPGSVVVFHDSDKAFENLAVALPAVLNTLRQAGYKFGKIIMENP